MATEDVKEPLMEAEDRYSTESDWEYSLKNRTVQHKNIILKKTLFNIFIALPWILLVLLSVWSWNTLHHYKTRYYIRPDLTYSPLQDLVQYETKIFTTGAEGDPDVSPYALEPSDEVDELWKGLYPNVFQLIPQEQAAKLVNQTVLFPHDEQRRYVIELDVFHQLHCLNMVRKATRPDYYIPHVIEGEDEDRLLGKKHIAHCIDAIRQSLMCAADITVYTWSWDEELQTYRNHVKNPHTCRNFDILREWSRVNTKMSTFDWHYRVPNDPLDPSTWIDGYAGD